MVGKQSQDQLAVSASMRTALLVYSGITVKMMVDSDLGAQLTTMFMVQYDPDGVAGPHDHPFEETYYFLEGRGRGRLRRRTYRLGPATSRGPGSAACTGSATSATGRCAGWRPRRRNRRRRHSYRFARDWDYCVQKVTQMTDPTARLS